MEAEAGRRWLLLLGVVIIFMCVSQATAATRPPLCVAIMALFFMRSVVPGMAFIHYSFNFKWSFVDTFLGSLHRSTSGGRTFVVITTFDVNISKHLFRLDSKLGVCRCFVDPFASLMPGLERIMPHKSRAWMLVVQCRIFITALSELGSPGQRGRRLPRSHSGNPGQH